MRSRMKIRKWIKKYNVRRDYDSIRKHMMNIGITRRSGKLVVFWSFVSLCYIFGDLQIDPENEIVVWGIKLLGVTNQKIVILLAIINVYFLMNFIFIVIRVCLTSNSIVALIDMISMNREEKIRAQDKILNWKDYDDDDPAKEKRREISSMMIKFRYMGALEYFFAPIIFPSLLGFLAITMLLYEI